MCYPPCARWRSACLLSCFWFSSRGDWRHLVCVGYPEDAAHGARHRARHNPAGPGKGRKLVRKWLFGSLLALTVGATAQANAAALNVCIWGTITGPDALVNGMSYGIRDYLEYLNQTQGGIAGNKVNTLLLDGRYKLDEEL